MSTRPFEVTKNHTLLLPLVFLLASGTLAAQESTGTLYGTVTSQDGARVPGATVTVSSPQLIGGAQVRVTGQQGTYRVPFLGPGTYSVKFELPAFQTLTRTDIVLSAGAQLAIDAVLQLSGVEETVTVTGESVLIDLKGAQTTRIIDERLLLNIPTGRSYADAILLAPGTTSDTYERAPLQSVHGQSVRNNLYNIDGAYATDNTTGYAIQNIPFETIAELQMTTTGISAEYGQATGAVFNIITKSGGNDLNGAVQYYLLNDSLQSDNLSDDLVAQGITQGSVVEKEQQFGGNLGGPIMKDKVWFFGHYQNRVFDKTNPAFTAGVPRIDDREYFFKVTSQVTSAVQLIGSYSDRTFEQNPANASFGTNDDSRTWDRLVAPHKIGILGATWVMNESTFIEARVSKAATRFDRQYKDADGTFVAKRTSPSTQLGYQDIATGVLSGGYTRAEGKFWKRDNMNYRASISHFNDDLAGTHNLKAGFDALFNPILWTRSRPGALLHRLRNGQPHRIRLYNTPNKTANEYTRYAGYIQDEWSPGDRMTLSLGVRLEWTEGWLPAQQGGGGPWGFPVIDYPEQRNLVDVFSASPRFGLVYDLTGTGRSSLKVSYGRYYERLRGSINPNTPDFQELDWNDLNGDLVFQDGEQGTLRRNLRSFQRSFDPDLRQPYVDAFSAAVEWQLGDDVSFSVTGVYKAERDITATMFADVDSVFDGFIPISVVNPLDGQTLTIFTLDPALQGVSRPTFLTNPTDPDHYRDYKGVEFVARKRMRNRWQFLGSLNLSRATGTIGNNFSGRTDFTNPNALISYVGPLSLDTPVQLKLQGTYQAPHGIFLSAFYNGLSGYPTSDRSTFAPGTQTRILGSPVVRFTRAENPQIVAESFIDVAGKPRGTDRFEYRHLLSFRVEKQFEMGQWKLGLIADVFNLFNINEILAVQSLRFGHPNFLKPSVIETPRAFRLGVRVGF